MPAAAVRGIILSISLITALSVVVLDNPQVQAWLEQQRQKIAELLRTIGEELDPQSRREAEAFAFQGRTTNTDAGLRRELSGSAEAAAIATGRVVGGDRPIRRIPVRGPQDPDEAEERRRKGREYLAKRNQEIYELKQRKKAAKAEGSSSPAEAKTPTFDAWVDEEGKLKLVDVEKQLPSVPATEPMPPEDQPGLEQTQQLLVPLAVEEPSSSSTGWNFGALLANPFSDELGLDRIATPKPPVPPKVAIENESNPTMKQVAKVSDLRQAREELEGEAETKAREQSVCTPLCHIDELSYDEQLAIALSLSEADAETEAVAARRQSETDEEESSLRAAIAASLKLVEVEGSSSTSAPLVDLSTAMPAPQAQAAAVQGLWGSPFDSHYSPMHEPLSLAKPQHASHVKEEELYDATPELTHARLASHNDSQSSAAPLSTIYRPPYDPVREAAHSSRDAAAEPAAMDATFYSAASAVHSPPPQSTTIESEPIPPLIDLPAQDGTAEGARTPTSRSVSSFRTDEESDSDTFGSFSPLPTRTVSRSRSETSTVEVIDLPEGSDVDMLSEEGDGIATPDSWTEVGSRDEESEAEEERPWR